MSIMLVIHVIQRRLWIVVVTFIVTIIGALAVLLIIPPRYEGTATASIDPSVTDPVSGQPSVGNNIMYLQGNLIALAKSSLVALSVVERLKLDSDPAIQAQYRSSPASGLVDIRKWFADKIADRVDARFTPGANVLSILYKAQTPQEASLFANAFMASFIDAAIAQKVSSAQRTAEWFAPQMKKLRDNLATAREKLSRFQTESNVLAPTTGNSESAQLLAATNDLSKAKEDLVAMEGQYAAPVQTAAASNEAQSVDLQSLNNLRSLLSNVDAEIARLQTEIGPNNPKLLERFATRQSLKKQIEAQNMDFRRKLADRMQTQKDKIATLEKVYNERMKSMIDVQTTREKMDSLKKDVQFEQEELERALKTGNIARLQSQLSFSNIVILDQASPPSSAAFPKKLVVVFMAVCLGLILGILFCLLAEAFDRRVRDGLDLEFVTGTLLLGTIPNIAPGAALTAFSRLKTRLTLMVSREAPSTKDGNAIANL